MVKKKILLLGGSQGQLPAIVEAKKRKLYTILCDYLSQNPGRNIADEFHLVSTTDKEKVLKIAQEKEIDFVLAYASDPAALTAAFVSQQMGLFGNTPESVEVLARKDLFRKLQLDEGFNSPVFTVVKSPADFEMEDVKNLLRFVVKPVDSSDTKGVTLVESISGMRLAIKNALSYSICKKVIIEELIDSEGGRLHGDGFVLDGKLKFCELGDQLFTSKSAQLKPSGTVYPSSLSSNLIKSVEDQVEKIIQKSGFINGPINIEARIDANDQIFIMEIGPRSGGILTPQGIFLCTGVDMLSAQMDLIMGKPVNLTRTKSGFSLRFTLHSNKKGVFKDFQLPEIFQPHVNQIYMFVNSGDKIKSFDQPGSNLGVLLFTFSSRNEMNKILDGFYEKIEDALSIEVE